MKSSCFKYVIAPLILIVVLATILHFSQRWQRHHLFCDEIKMGMSSKEVLLIIDQHGKFSKAQFDNSEETTILIGPFVDFRTSLIYGGRGLELKFRNDILLNAIEKYKLEDGIYELCE